jgi:hypothetical protein
MIFQDHMRVSVSIVKFKFAASKPLKGLLESAELILTVKKCPSRDTIPL